MLITALLLFAQNTPGADSSTQNTESPLQSTQATTEAAIPHITWFTQWDQAVKEAKRHNRPILLQGAAPVCSDVPGMWWQGYQRQEESFFSDIRVIEASKGWVCVRLATYESAEEAIVLERWLKGVRGGGGEIGLRNTTFALLDPSGEKALGRTGRSPQMVYKDIDSFASALSSLASKFDSVNRKEIFLIESLPLIPSLRLGLNIAACDSLPLVVVIEDDSDEQREKFLYLTHLSRTDSLAGQAHYVLLKNTKEIEDLKNYKEGNFVYVLKPDNFGVTGEVVAAFQDQKTLSVVALETAFNIAQTPKKYLNDSRQHVRKGKREGITWESQLPRADGSARSTSPKDRPHLKE